MSKSTKTIGVQHADNVIPLNHGRAPSKTDQLIELLRRDGGASIEEISEAFGWFKSAQSQEPDMALVELMARAQRTRDRMLAGEVDPDNRHARRLVRLAYLSRAIVTALVERRQPKGMTAGSLFRMTRLPLDWAEQERMVLG